MRMFSEFGFSFREMFLSKVWLFFRCNFMVLVVRLVLCGCLFGLGLCSGVRVKICSRVFSVC